MTMADGRPYLLGLRLAGRRVLVGGGGGGGGRGGGAPPPAGGAGVPEADQHRTWPIRADDAHRSAVWTPASGLAGDVQIGVLSGDPRHSPGLRDAIVTGLRSGTVGARRGRQHRSGVALGGGG